MVAFLAHKRQEIKQIKLDQNPCPTCRQKFVTLLTTTTTTSDSKETNGPDNDDAGITSRTGSNDTNDTGSPDGDSTADNVTAATIATIEATNINSGDIESNLPAAAAAAAPPPPAAADGEVDDSPTITATAFPISEDSANNNRNGNDDGNDIESSSV